MIPNTCSICMNKLTERTAGMPETTKYFCNYGQLRKFDGLPPSPPPEWCPLGGRPDVGMTDEEWEEDQRKRSKVDGRADCERDL